MSTTPAAYDEFAESLKLRPTTWKRRNLTPFFPADIRPVRRGVYECMTGPAWYVWYRVWNGQFWSVGAPTPEEARGAIQQRAFIQDYPWRGLARKAR